MSNELIPAFEGDPQGVGGGEAAPPPSAANRLRRFLAALKKHWWIPLITVVLGIGLGAFFAHRLVPVFVSSARMWETLKVQLPGESLYSEDMQNLMGTQTQLLQSEKMRELALTRLQAMTNSVTIPLDNDGEPANVTVSVNVIPGSSIFALDAAGADPTYTRNYLNALMESFINYDRDMRNTISGMTLASITDEITSLEEDLKNEEDALMTYERSNNVEILQNEQSVAGTYLEKLQAELADLQLQSKLLKTAEAEHEQVAAGGTNDAIPMAVINSLESGSAAGTTSPNPGNDDNLELMRLERAEMAKSLSTNSEKLAELDDQIKHAEQAELALQLETSRHTADQLAAYRLVNQIKINYDNDSIKEWRGKISEADRILSEVDRQKLNIQRTQSEYDRLTQLSQNLDISRSIDQESLAILERASPSYRSTSAEKKTLGLGIFGGLVAGLTIVFLIGYRDDRFTSLSDVNYALGDAVLGMLPKVQTEADGAPLLLRPNDTRHVYAESYRSLRSALHYLATGANHPKSILITSATPNEGKSTVAANLAQTLAMSGSRVLLVDGDLRRGQLHTLLGFKNEKGLADLLSGNCEPEQAIQVNCLSNLSFIARGSYSGNPGDLLTSPRLDELLARWSRDYDYVLLDSSPVFAAADSAALAPRVDGTIFLVRSHFSSARMTREALEVLAQRRARIIGVVFNMADTKAHDYKYYKYTEYHPVAQDEE
jgi:capsular exopolysaccharide synthesis family protein